MLDSFPNNATPKRITHQSVIVTPPHFVASTNILEVFVPSSLSKCGDETKSILQASISYHVLLPNNLFRLGDGYDVVLVLSNN